LTRATIASSPRCQPKITPGIAPALELVPLPLGHALYEPGTRMRHVVFPIDAIVSLLCVMEVGAPAEIAMVGQGVTEAAGKLQRAGLIEYHRGHINVLDRAGLETRVCACYAVVKREYDRLLSWQLVELLGAGALQAEESPGGSRTVR
jgi:hypothetical protein